MYRAIPERASDLHVVFEYQIAISLRADHIDGAITQIGDIVIYTGFFLTLINQFLTGYKRLGNTVKDVLCSFGTIVKIKKYLLAPKSKGNIKNALPVKKTPDRTCQLFYFVDLPQYIPKDRVVLQIRRYQLVSLLFGQKLSCVSGPCIRCIFERMTEKPHHDRSTVYPRQQIRRLTVINTSNITTGESFPNFSRHNLMTLQPILRIGVPFLGKINLAVFIKPRRIKSDFRSKKGFCSISWTSYGRSAQCDIIAKLSRCIFIAGNHN